MMRDWLGYKVKPVRDEEDEYIRRHCLAKTQYRTLESALIALDNLRIRHWNTHWKFDYYICNICENYHVGRTNGKVD